ncbi:MAG: M42 family peptidase, partial [Candidatus Hadarchaeota archaeon]
AIHLTKAGIPTGVVSIPSRYIHSPVEVIDPQDLKNTSLLVARAIESAGNHFK